MARSGLIRLWCNCLACGALSMVRPHCLLGTLKIHGPRRFRCDADQIRDQLVAAIAAGEKPDERPGASAPSTRSSAFTLTTTAPVPYEGAARHPPASRGHGGLLGWEPILDHGNIIGLTDPTGRGAISLEPGGQFELSGAPLENIHQTLREVNGHLAQVRECAEPLGIGFLGFGASPKWTLAETPVMPKSRYAIMTRYMPKVGTPRPRHDVPHLHRAGEPRLRRRSRHGPQDARRPRAAADRHRPLRQLALHRRRAQRLPVLALGEIWLDTDPDRTGMLPFAFEPGLRLRALCRLGARRADVFRQARRPPTTTSPAPHSATCSPAGWRSLPGEHATISDWTNHLSTLFPEVRLKTLPRDARRRRRPWPRHAARCRPSGSGCSTTATSLDAAWQIWSRTGARGAAGAARRRAEDRR